MRWGERAVEAAVDGLAVPGGALHDAIERGISRWRAENPSLLPYVDVAMRLGERDGARMRGRDHLRDVLGQGKRLPNRQEWLHALGASVGQ